MNLTHEELDRLRELDLVEIMTRDGLAVDKLPNGSFKALCPFHPDKNPSMSVNLKGRSWLWHCFGCGAGGDVLKYVMLKKSISFKDACFLLMDDLPDRSVGAGTGEVLRAVTDHYTKTLGESREAQEYLERRGLLDRELIKRFKIGYSDGTLPKDPDAASPLKDHGILREDGSEHFRGCITFPIENSFGQTVSFYGRSIKDKKHLYPKGPHQGLFNWKAASRTTKLFITEGVIDALSIVRLGAGEATCLYGTQGFTPDHEELLKSPSLKEIYLCLDNDEAGRAAAQRLTPKIPTSVDLYEVRLPEGIKDPNDFLLSGKSKEDLMTLVQKIDRPSETQADFQVNESSQEITYDLNDRSYRVRGLSLERLDTLRVALRLKNQKGQHHDTLDLYNSKMRQNFARDAQRQTQTDQDQVERDLKLIVDKLEDRQSRLLASKETTRIVHMTEDEKREAFEYLKDPHIFDRILADAKLSGHIGEEENFLLGYLVSVSRKLKNPLGLLVIAQSSAGKTALQDRILSFTPPEDAIKITRLTDQSLFYQEKNALKHKLIAIEEEEGAQGAGYSIRHLLTSNGLKSLTTVRDETHGRLKSVSHEVEGPTSMMITTTHSEINYETYNRFIIVTIDESFEQTKSILKMQRDSETLEGLLNRKRKDEILKVHHNLQRLLRPIEIVNPLAPGSIFTDSVLRARREQAKFLSLIRVVAFLRQHQKTVHTTQDAGKSFEYIEVDEKDVAIARRIASDVFKKALDEVTPLTRKFLDQVHELVRRLKSQTQKDALDIVISRRQMREYTKWSDYQVRKHVDELTELEYLVPVAGSRGKRFTYVLVWEPMGEPRDNLATTFR